MVLKPELILYMIIEAVVVESNFSGSFDFSLEDFSFQPQLRNNVVRLAKEYGLTPLYIKIFSHYQDESFVIQWQLPMTRREWRDRHADLHRVMKKLRSLNEL